MHRYSLASAISSHFGYRYGSERSINANRMGGHHELVITEHSPSIQKRGLVLADGNGMPPGSAISRNGNGGRSRKLGVPWELENNSGFMRVIEAAPGLGLVAIVRPSVSLAITR